MTSKPSTQTMRLSWLVLLTILVLGLVTGIVSIAGAVSRSPIIAIDKCASAAGWSGMPDAVDNGAGKPAWVRAFPVAYQDGRIFLTRDDLNVDMRTTPYLRVGGYIDRVRDIDGKTGQTRPYLWINDQLVRPTRVVGSWLWYKAPARITSITLWAASDLDANYDGWRNIDVTCTNLARSAAIQ